VIVTNLQSFSKGEKLRKTVGCENTFELKRDHFKRQINKPERKKTLNFVDAIGNSLIGLYTLA